MRTAILLLFVSSIAYADDPLPNELWPLAIGNSWTFKVSGQDERFVMRVAGLEKIGEQLTHKIEASLRERVVATEFILADKEGLYRHRLDKEDIVPPLCLCKVPTMQRKTTWKLNYRLGNKFSAVTYTMTNEETINVPAGKFKAVRVDADTNDNGVRVRTSYWFAPKVGLVKQTIEEAKRITLTLELEKYELK